MVTSGLLTSSLQFSPIQNPDDGITCRPCGLLQVLCAVPPWPCTPTVLGPLAAGPFGGLPAPLPLVFCVQITSYAPGVEASAVTVVGVTGSPHSSLHPAHLLKPSGLPLTRPPLLSLCPLSCPCPSCSFLKVVPWSLFSPSSAVGSCHFLSEAGYCI